MNFKDLVEFWEMFGFRKSMILVSRKIVEDVSEIKCFGCELISIFIKVLTKCASFLESLTNI